MFNSGFDDMFFTSQYVNGLRDEIKHPVQSQLPDSVDRAYHLAQIQQQILEKSKSTTVKFTAARATNSAARTDVTPSASNGLLWKERQLRDYRRANNLCYFCGDKFDPAHLHKCPKRNKPQVNALVVNTLDAELTEDTLNQLEMEDVLAEEMGQLPLNALSGTEKGDSMRIRALVHNQVMLILVDSGSSHSFVSRSFVQHTNIQAEEARPLQVRVANGGGGGILSSSTQVSSMEWWAQGHTFHTDMRVLDLTAYDAILGYDWLRSHSPMVCHWELKTMEFQDKDKLVRLQGV
jgi:hypothetical protein